MIRWCSYCQSFIGQSPPLNHFTFSHGICAACKQIGKKNRGSIKVNADVEVFLRELFQKINQGIFAEPIELFERSKSLNISKADLLLGVLHPLLWQIGQHFEEGKISVEKEHLFSKAVNEVIKLLDLEAVNDKAPILLLSARDNTHSIGLQFFRQLIVSKFGMDVHLLGHPPETAEEYKQIVLTFRPKVIGISFALPSQLDYLRQVMQWRGECAAEVGLPFIMAGGPAVSELGNYNDLKDVVFVSDVYNINPTLEEVGRLCGFNGVCESLSPLAPASIQSQAIPGGPEDVPKMGGVLRIIFLDDEKDLCYNFVDDFSSTKVTIEAFTDPVEMLQAAKESPPDLLFIDYNLPGTTGDKVAALLENSIPKYLLTGDSKVKPEYKFQSIIV
jgi:methanogenic corrinoid protein MtbC1